jgi:syntaxin 6
MLDDFGNELENTDSKLDSTMKKVAKVLHMTNGKQNLKDLEYGVTLSTLLGTLYFVLLPFLKSLS